MIRILFTKRHKFNPVSWLILKMEKTNYSHVAIYFQTDLGPIVFHTSLFGVVPTSFNEFIKHNEIKQSIDIEPGVAQKQLMFRRALSLVGTKFSILGLIGAGLTRIFKMKNNIFSDGNKTEFCSEFVYDVLDEVFILDGYNPEIDGPKMLNKLLKEYVCQKN